MEIKAFSQDMIKAFVPPANAYLISIGDPGESPLVLQNGWSGVLRLNFHDIDLIRYITPSIPDFWAAWEPLKKCIVFNFEHARKIKDFVFSKDIIDLLAINCHAGVSRSVGIRVALERFINRRDVSGDIINSCYNQWVCAVLTEALYEQPQKPSEAGSLILFVE